MSRTTSQAFNGPGGPIWVATESSDGSGVLVPVGSSGGGGGAVTVADGADVAQGAVADAAYTSGSGTVVSLLKAIFAKLLTNGINTGTPTETAVSVLVTSTTVLAANANRKYLQIQNDSANIIYISFSGTAVADTGTRLNANGGSVVWDGGYIPTGAVKGIALTGTSVLLVTEG